jgi:hypothetical protein
LSLVPKRGDARLGGSGIICLFKHFRIVSAWEQAL